MLSMKKVMTTLTLFSLAASAQAFSHSTSEDRSRFEEREYTKAEPPLLSPSQYIERAKQAVHSWHKEVHFRKYEDGEVTRRFYRDAPPADRDIICVSFVTRDVLILPRATVPVFGAILVLTRKDLSKTYINQIYIGVQGWSSRLPTHIYATLAGSGSRATALTQSGCL